jgi:hypothetical protein
VRRYANSRQTDCIRFNSLRCPLIRRRDPNRPECWHVYYGNVQVGTIARRVGNPHDTDPWERLCGLYLAAIPVRNGTSGSFDQASADFGAAWALLLPKRTEADFDKWRRHTVWTAWKYAMWDAGCRMPAQNTSGRSRCFCGTEIDLKNTEAHVYAAHMTDLQPA